MNRYEDRRPRVSLEPYDAETGEFEEADWLPDEAESLEDTAIRGEVADAIRHCLNDVPDSFRGLIVMIDMQGLSYEEAGEVVGLPVGTVKSRLARGRKLLSWCLRTIRELFWDF